jgi:hypothetical protein
MVVYWAAQMAESLDEKTVVQMAASKVASMAVPLENLKADLRVASLAES